MPDNTTFQSTTPAMPPAGLKVATRKVTYSGEADVDAQAVGLVTFAGADDAKVPTDVPGGGGTEAAALRVTVASDSTGVLSVDDNGGSLTVDAASLPLPSGASTSALQGAGLPAALGAGGGLKVDGSGTALPVSGTVAISNAVALDATLGTTNTAIGIVTEAAPASDTASSGLNGRLQRIAQNITTHIAAILKVGGDVASGATDSGNPVLIGGRAATGQTPVTAGQRVAAWFGLAGQAVVSSGYAATGVDAVPNTVTYDLAFTGNNVVGPALAAPLAFNGSTWDRARSVVSASALASAARTVATSTPDQTNYNGRGALCTLNVTVEGAATLSVAIWGKDSISSNYYLIVDFGVVYTAATEAPTLTKTLVVYPGVLTADFAGIGVGINGATGKSVVLPRTWKAIVTPADATTTTYSLSIDSIL
jgi:hypothetical protein